MDNGSALTVEVPSGAARPVRTRSRECPECHRIFAPRRNWHFHCCDTCRVKGWKARQQPLPLEPAPVPLPPVQDQRVGVVDQERLQGHNYAVLNFLRLRPATNRELALLLPPGAAWRSRVSDVRQWLERRGETVRSKTSRGGLCTYWLESL